MEVKYYRRKQDGGWSPCILGNNKIISRHSEMNVLPNCVGYATGRYNEIAKEGSCKYLGNANAENFTIFATQQSLETGSIPKKGACMVWEGKGDLAGHVAIVEEVYNNTSVRTSESGWSAKSYYWNQTRNKGNGNWGQNDNYKFKCFIYQPKPKYETIEPKLMVVKNTYIDKWDLTFNKWNEAKSVQVLEKNELVLVVAKYRHQLGGVYYITKEDYDDEKFVGINAVDIEEYVEEEIIEEQPKEEEPKDEGQPKEEEEIDLEALVVRLFKILIASIKKIFDKKKKI